MDVMVKMARFQIKQNVLNLKSILESDPDKKYSDHCVQLPQLLRPPF